MFDETHLRDTLGKVFREQAVGSKLKQQLYEYAASYDEPVLAQCLVQNANFEAAWSFHKQQATLANKYLASDQNRIIKDVLRQCDQYGVEHRTAMNLTPLMAAAAAGNLPLVEALLERGADLEAIDHLGRNALHWAMQEAFRQEKYAKGSFAAVYDLVAPSAVDVQAGERLIRIDRHLTEYFLLQTLWVLFKGRFNQHYWGQQPAFDTGCILEAWQHLPAHVLNPERNKRSHLSNVLSRNEVDRDYAYNRRLFKRLRQGWYQFNPALAVRRKEGGQERWLPIYQALNLPLVKEFADPTRWPLIDRLLSEGACPAVGTPIAMERSQQQALGKQLHPTKPTLFNDQELQAALRAFAKATPKPGEFSAPRGAPKKKR